jgi:integrase
MSGSAQFSPVSRDALSKDVPPPPTPFADLAMPQAAYRDLRQELANAVLPRSATDTLGLTLLSAIVFGALLDERGLAALMFAARAGTIRADWVELTIWLPRKHQIHRRWFPDQRTHGLLQTLPYPLPGLQIARGAARQLTAEAMHSLGCARDFDWLIKQARLWWRLRLPAVVADHAEGLLLAGSVPPENWARITGGLGQQGPVNATLAPGWAAMSSPASTAPASGQSVVAANAVIQDRAALRAALQEVPNTALNRHQVKQQAAAALARVIPRSAICQHLRDWLIASLTTGPHHVRPRGKPSFPVMPSTLGRELQNLPPVFLSAMESRQGDIEQLIDLYEDWIDTATDPRTQMARAITVRFLHRWLVQTAGWPALTIVLDDGQAEKPARASLVTEVEFKTALALADQLSPTVTCPDPAAAKVALILGFRAGLRPAEATRPRLDDVRIESDSVILAVRSNQQSKAKTPSARRLVPLHLLLPPAELELFTRYVQQRKRTAGRGAFLLTSYPNDLGVFVLSVLRQATGGQNVRRHDLRHSFASCLAATMLLPDPLPGQQAPDFPFPGFGPDCISIERRDALRSQLLGYNLGRPSLFALTFLMGHAGPHRAVNTYVHLLDWVLSVYVAQRHDGTLPAPQPLGPPVASAGIAPSAPPRYPSLQALWRAYTEHEASKASATRPALTGLSAAERTRMGSRLAAILRIMTTKGTLRHRLGRVRRDEGSDAAEHLWQTISAQRAIMADREVAWALMEWLNRFDNERNDLPFHDLATAGRFVAAMQALGFTHQQIAVRFRRNADDNGGQWHLWSAGTWTPGQGGVPLRVRPRIGLVVSHNGKINATPSFRVLVLFLIAATSFNMPNS